MYKWLGTYFWASSRNVHIVLRYTILCLLFDIPFHILFHILFCIFANNLWYYYAASLAHILHIVFPILYIIVHIVLHTILPIILEHINLLIVHTITLHITTHIEHIADLFSILFYTHTHTHIFCLYFHLHIMHIVLHVSDINLKILQIDRHIFIKFGYIQVVVQTFDQIMHGLSRLRSVQVGIAHKLELESAIQGHSSSPADHIFCISFCTLKITWCAYCVYCASQYLLQNLQYQLEFFKLNICIMICYLSLLLLLASSVWVTGPFNSS